MPTTEPEDTNWSTASVAAARAPATDGRRESPNRVGEGGAGGRFAQPKSAAVGYEAWAPRRRTDVDATCVDIKFRAPHAIDVTLSPWPRRLDGVGAHEGPRNISQDNLTHWLIFTQVLCRASSACL